jgi:hypothetical protein
MSTLLYSGKILQGKLEHQVATPPSRLLVDVSIGTSFDGSCNAVLSASGVYGQVTPAPRNPDLDLYLDIQDEDVFTLTGEICGIWANVTITENTFSLIGSLLGTYVPGIVVSGLLPDLVASLRAKDAGLTFATALKSNWVKWSNIGSLDFTVWKDNVAGERPLDWKGLIYSIKKLGNKVVAYGKNGVSILIPAGNIYGLQTVHRIGLKGKLAIAGDNAVHFFVDTKGDLYLLGEMVMKSSLFEASMQPAILGYSEYLAEMNDLVLSWDAENRLLYICDGATGYVYNPKDKSLGSGPINITGIGSQNGTLYATSPTDISIPSFEICTDIYDFNTNKYKTIHELEFGTNITGTLQAAIDYRDNVKADFTQTAWKDVSSRGNVYITALGREFRFRAKIGTYEYLELDYITTRGILHDH